MAIRVYNTLTRNKEEFVPRDSNKVAIYICGPTVYNFIHIGNARCYVAFDAIVRYFEYQGFEITYVRNITDVDDKIIKKAQEEKTTSSDIAEKYAKAFHEDMQTLGCREPDIEPTATETIPAMLKIISGLIEKGFAYEVDGDVFFEITKFDEYGKLSGRTLEEMRAGERVEVDPRKHHPMDFALWKNAKPGEPSWPSPWGQGRPGWHIECSAMSLDHLGMGLDIHGGGQDLIFPHHENEIAQSEAYAGTKPFVKYWLHNGFVTIKAEKMAKSVGNVVLIHDLSEQYRGKEINLRNALRMLFLSTHYRSPIDFSKKHLEEAERKVRGLVDLVWRLDEILGKDIFSELEGNNEQENTFENKVIAAKEKFQQAMDDDFNTPAAVGAMFELERHINIFMDGHRDKYSLREKELLEKAKETIIELGRDVLGLEFVKAASSQEGFAAGHAQINKDLLNLAQEFFDDSVDDSSDEASMVERLLEKREQARADKDFAAADKIRACLTEIGVVIEDTPHGARWKWK